MKQKFKNGTVCKIKSCITFKAMEAVCISDCKALKKGSFPVYFDKNTSDFEGDNYYRINGWCVSEKWLERI